MFGNLKFPIALVALCIMLEEAASTPGCQQPKKKCKRKKNVFLNLTTSRPVTKLLKLKGQNETSKPFPKRNESIPAIDLPAPVPLELPEKYRTEKYEEVNFPSDIPMVAVVMDGMPWLWPQDKLHVLKNSTDYKPQRGDAVLSSNSTYSASTEMTKFRIVTKDGFCIEVYNAEVQELECRNHELQTFSLVPTAMSDTYLIRGPHDNCIAQGGQLQNCNKLDPLQRFAKRKNKFYVVGEDGLLCPWSRGIGGRGFEMANCPSVATYTYEKQSLSEALPTPEYHRIFNDDGFCVAIFTNLVSSYGCSAIASYQMIRKIQRPGLFFKMQSRDRLFVMKVHTKDSNVMTFVSTNDYKVASTFSFDEAVNKLITGEKECVTMLCRSGLCDPRNKKAVPRPCIEGWHDQLFQIKPFDEKLGGHKKSWVTISVNPGIGRTFRCLRQGGDPDECTLNLPKDDPLRWFKTSQYDVQDEKLYVWSTTAVGDSTAMHTRHFMFSGDSGAARWDCEPVKKLCVGFTGNYVIKPVTSDVYAA